MTSSTSTSTSTPISISTPRLCLRAFTLRDLDAFVAYRREPLTARYQSWSATDFSETEGRAFIEHVTRFPLGGTEWVNLAVEHIETHALVGDVGLRRISGENANDRPAEIGFTFSQAHQRNGFAREAVGALVLHAFDTLGLTRIVAQIDARNDAASKLLVALAFRESHRAREVEFKGEICEELTFERSPTA